MQKTIYYFIQRNKKAKKMEHEVKDPTISSGSTMTVEGAKKASSGSPRFSPSIPMIKLNCDRSKSIPTDDKWPVTDMSGTKRKRKGSHLL